jgi:hypothetical protein
MSEAAPFRVCWDSHYRSAVPFNHPNQIEIARAKSRPATHDLARALRHEPLSWQSYQFSKSAILTTVSIGGHGL